MFYQNSSSLKNEGLFFLPCSKIRLFCKVCCLQEHRSIGTNSNEACINFMTCIYFLLPYTCYTLWYTAIPYNHVLSATQPSLLLCTCVHTELGVVPLATLVTCSLLLQPNIEVPLERVCALIGYLMLEFRVALAHFQA